jgi:hypothetical protein
MKIINIFIIIFFFLHIIFAQDFIISSDDIIPASFVQNSPTVYQTPSGELLFAWKDYRHGDEEYYAQFLDDDGIKIGDNFPFYSNQDIAFLSSQDFLVLKNIPYEIYYEPYYEEYGFNIFIQNYINRKAEGDPISIYGNIWPWCGTGFLGFYDDLTVQNNNYLYCAQFNGYLSIIRISSEGTLISRNDDFNFKCLDFSIHSWTDTQYTLFYFGFPAPEYSDSVVIGMYAVTLNNQDQLLNKPELIEYISTDDFSMWAGSERMYFESISLSDSVVEIFYFNKDSLCLKYFTSGQNGKNDSTKSITIPSFTDRYLSFDKFELSNLYEGNFILHLAAHYYESYPSNITHYFNYMYYFDEQGDFTGEVVIDSLKETSLLNGFIKTGNNKFISAHDKNNDIYAIWTNDFEKNAEQKLNDDYKGANQVKPQIVKAGPDNFFISWEDENGSRGRMIDGEGNLKGEEQIIKNKPEVFFNDYSSLSLWNYHDEAYEISFLGFTLYNADMNAIKYDTLYNGVYNWADKISVLDIVRDSVIIAIAAGRKTELFLYNSRGILLDKKLMPYTDAVYNLKLFNHNNTFYVTLDYSLWLCNYALTAISSEYILDTRPELYLGSQRFLSRSILYEEGYEIGTIVDINNDTLASGFKIADINTNCSIQNLGNNNFISMYQLAGDLYAQVFTNTGMSEGSPFIIHDTNTGKQKEPYVSLNGDKILFCWSDNRNPELGYTIMGNLQSVDHVLSTESNPIYQPSTNQLNQNYPNPFNPETVICWKLAKTSHVELCIYNLLGQKIATLVNENQSTGTHKIAWNASDVSSGVYYYRLTTDNGYSQIRKMIVLK